MQYELVRLVNFAECPFSAQMVDAAVPGATANSYSLRSAYQLAFLRLTTRRERDQSTNQVHFIMEACDHTETKFFGKFLYELEAKKLVICPEDSRGLDLGNARANALKSSKWLGFGSWQVRRL